MNPPETYPNTQGFVRLIGSACGRRVLTSEEAELLEWCLIQVALEGSGPVNEVLASYRSSLLAGADWHSAAAAAFLQTPRQWDAEIQAALFSFEEIRNEYRKSEIAVFQFADELITDRIGQVPPFPGYAPTSAPEDPRTGRLFQLAAQMDVTGEAMELAGVIVDRFPHIVRGTFKLTFEGALAAFLCDLEIEGDRVARLLSFSALLATVFRTSETRDV